MKSWKTPRGFINKGPLFRPSRKQKRKRYRKLLYFLDLQGFLSYEKELMYQEHIYNF